MEQQQKKRDGSVRCVCEERRASAHRKSAEPEVVHGSVPKVAQSAVSISVFWCHILKMIYKNQCLIGSLLVSGVIKMSETKSYLGFY